VDGTGRAVARDSNSKGVFDRAEVGDLPLAFKLFAESISFVYRRGRRDNVIDVEDKYGRASRRLSVIYTPFARQSDEVPTLRSLVEGLVPYTAGLFHPVYAFEQFHDPVFFSLGLEARRLLEVHGFIVRENTVKERGLNVELVNVPVKGCGDVE